MIFALVLWPTIALIVGLVSGLGNEETFLVDFRHGFRWVIALPFSLAAVLIYLLATVMFTIYDVVGNIAEFILGDK